MAAIPSLLKKLNNEELHFILDNLLLPADGNKSDLIDRIIVGVDEYQDILWCMSKTALALSADELRIDNSGSRDILLDRLLRYFNDNIYPNQDSDKFNDDNFIDIEDLLYLLNISHLKIIADNLGIKSGKRKHDLVKNITAYIHADIRIAFKNSDRKILATLGKYFGLRSNESYPVLYRNFIAVLSGDANEDMLEGHNTLFDSDDDPADYDPSQIDLFDEEYSVDDEDMDDDEYESLADDQDEVEEIMLKLLDIKQEMLELLDILTVVELNEILTNLCEPKNGNKNSKIMRIIEICKSNPLVILQNMSTYALQELCFEFDMDGEIPRHLMIKYLNRMIHEETFGEYDPFFFEENLF